jgi:RNA polymerase sigma factor (sigma-70 family)
MDAGFDPAELIRGCLDGRKSSWDSFVDRYSRLVYWSVWKILKNQNDPVKVELCREIFQDFFEKALERKYLERLLSAKNLRNYIQSMVCHLTFDRLRHVSRQGRLESPIESLDLETSEVGAGPDMREVVAGEEIKGVLNVALGALSAKEKSCVELCYLDGRTHREIGLLLNMPQDTVSTVLRRSKERLKKALEEKGISG